MNFFEVENEEARMQLGLDGIEEQEAIACNKSIIDIKVDDNKIWATLYVIYVFICSWVKKIKDCQKLINDFKSFVGGLFQLIKDLINKIYYSKVKKRDIFKKLYINLFL